MGTGATLAAVGTLVLAGVGYLVIQLIGDFAADEAKEAVFRRASFAARRSRHRALMKAGFICAVLAFLAALFCLAAATSGHAADAGDARVFALVSTILALTGGGLLTTWWRRAGRPPT